MRLLLVEDDDALAAAVAQGFREAGVDVLRVASAAEARARVASLEFDLLVLDVMLAGAEDGFVFCADLRRRGVTTPVLMLTARDAVDDRVRGLELGADDYLTKPFAFAELLARARALARRPSALAAERVVIGDLEVDLRTRTVRRADRDVMLTAKEFALLELFVRRPGEVLDRDAIAARVWDDNFDPFTNVVDVLVGRLRRKIDDGADRKLIHTLRGVGYRFGLDG
jgi:two-component system, OmpR family, copper resistance phosphate regulon response regulator CusR